MNIILIVSDTLRQDHLGCYGNKKIQTPHLDAFAEICVQFDNCYHASFPTMPHRADLFTGKFTFTYLDWNPLPLEEKILAELLKKAGYTTLAAVDTPFFIKNGYGYDRGFKDFIFIQGQHGGREGPRINYERRYEADYCAPKTMSAAEKLLEYYYKGKFFLYIDTWDPHEPWDPPCWYVEPYYPGYDGRIVHPCYCDWREKGLSEEDIKIAHACYCGEITMVDHWVGRFLDKVMAMGLWEDTAIIFTSDHGYYFGEHGLFGKGRVKKDKATIAKYGKQVWVQSPLYQEITRVPLLIYVPGLKPRKEKALVSSVDLMPTILDIAVVEIPKTVQGQSLLPLLKAEKNSLRDFAVSSFPLYDPGEECRIVDDELRSIEQPHFSTITTDKWTFLYSTEAQPAQLYDIEHDPTEVHNIIRQSWSVAEDLHQKFVRLLEEVGTDERYLTTRRRLCKF